MDGVLTVLAAEANVYSDITVALLGFGTVLFGIMCIILLCMLFSRSLKAVQGKNEAEVAAPVMPQAQPVVPGLTAEERGAVIAAVSAVIAEELGKDVSAIRIHSFKRI